jgi:hypothetical protein
MQARKMATRPNAKISMRKINHEGTTDTKNAIDMSFSRRRELSGCGGWIPACAGMTITEVARIGRLFPKMSWGIFGFEI